MPDEKKPTMGDAINDVLESLKPAEPAAVVDPPAQDPPADSPVDPPAGDDPAGETDGEQETPEAKAAREAAEAAAETPEAKAAREAAAAETPEAKAAREAAAAKKPDHVNDPIPQELKAQTQERIRSLAGEVKELRPIAETGRMLLDAMDNAGMSPQELQYALNYSKLIHSDNIEDKRKGFAILMNELNALAPTIGEALPGTDPVAAHADLVQEVKDGKLTPARAKEIAVNRDRAAAAGKAQQTIQQKQETEAQFEQARVSAVAELNEIGKQLAENDPHYQIKYDAIVPALKNSFANIHPSRWKTVFLNTYNNWKVSLPAPAPTPAPAPAPPAAQPLRANKQPAGGGVATPKTMREAMDAGIAQASGRR